MAGKPGSLTRDSVGEDSVQPPAPPGAERPGERKQLSVIDRIIAQGIAGNKEFGDPFDPIKSKCPLLWRALTSTEAGPDHTKEPAKLSLKCTPGGAWASLSDDTFGYSLDASCDTLEQCFEALEHNLALPQPPVRYWPNHEVKAKKKRPVK